MIKFGKNQQIILINLRNEDRNIRKLFERKHLTSLCSLKLDEVKTDELKVYHNQIMDGQVITSSCINEKLLKELHESYILLQWIF